MPRRRKLLPMLRVTRLYDYEQEAAAFAARYPGREAYSDVSVCDFATVAAWMDNTSPGRLVRVLREAGVTVPAALCADRAGAGE